MEETSRTAPRRPPGWQRLTGAAFDRLQQRWEHPATGKTLSLALVVAFLGSVLLIELSRQGVVSDVFGFPLPTNHLNAVSWVVTLLLIVEILDLVFAIAGSVSLAMGKQLEIFSLVLLRKTFDELPKFEEPIQVEGHLDALLKMGAEAGAALAIFVLLIAYYRVQKREPISRVAADVADFIAVKKLICLVLLAAFVLVGAVAGVGSLTLKEAEATLSLQFFELFYTILIFADILLVLISLSATRRYQLVFRNFAFAVVTVFVRLALAAPAYTNAILGLSAALFALGVSYAYLRATPLPRQDPHPRD